MAEPREALVVLAIDGATTLECGIGVAVSCFLRAYDQVRRLAPGPAGARPALYAIGPGVAAASPDHRADLAAEVAAVCAAEGGRLLTYPVPDGSSLRAAWGLADPAAWRDACAEAARLVRGIADAHSRTTVVAHGVMLTNLRSFLADRADVRVSFVAHSLGMAGRDPLARQRVDWETAGFAAMRAAPDDSVAYVSRFTQGLLRDSYGVPDDRLVPFLNGVWADDPKFARRGPAPEVLDRYGVPPDRDLVFSWGRCVPSKGFDLILDGWAALLDRDPGRDEHLVLLMPSAVAPADHAAALRDRCAALGPKAVTPVFAFSDELPAAVLTAPRLRAVVFASEFESYMLTAAEAITLAAPHVQHVYYGIPPVREQYAGMANAHEFGERAPGAVADALAAALGSGARDTKAAPDFIHEAARYLTALRPDTT
jgi:glycosyltransferase involved in cell wall biosynthesis